VHKTGLQPACVTRDTMGLEAMFVHCQGLSVENHLWGQVTRANNFLLPTCTTPGLPWPCTGPIGHDNGPQPDRVTRGTGGLEAICVTFRGLLVSRGVGAPGGGARG
jgi:hypothetical protein